MSTDVMTNTKSKFTVRTLAQIGMLSAIAIVLMLFEIPLPFAPSFYEIDFSEVPVLVGCFAMGPWAGAMIELIKILLNLAINGTMTAGVGEFANFLIGCAFVIPAGIIFQKRRHHRYGKRNSYYDYPWLFPERLPPASCLFQGFRAADGCFNRHGNCCKCPYQRPAHLRCIRSGAI